VRFTLADGRIRYLGFPFTGSGGAFLVAYAAREYAVPVDLDPAGRILFLGRVASAEDDRAVPILFVPDDASANPLLCSRDANNILTCTLRHFSTPPFMLGFVKDGAEPGVDAIYGGNFDIIISTGIVKITLVEFLPT
jgi:hypothetical protein